MAGAAHDLHRRITHQLGALAYGNHALRIEGHRWRVPDVVNAARQSPFLDDACGHRFQSGIHVGELPLIGVTKIDTESDDSRHGVPRRRLAVEITDRGTPERWSVQGQIVDSWNQRRSAGKGVAADVHGRRSGVRLVAGNDDIVPADPLNA